MSTYSAPGAFETSMGRGYFGGRFTVKYPTNGVQVMQLSPPSITAGCSGIDMFGGSFGFIDAAQFEALLRRVAQNAKGYFFHLLLDNVFPEGAKIVENMQEKINALNQSLSNSCQLAQGIVTGGIDKLGGDKLFGPSIAAANNNSISDVSTAIGGMLNVKKAGEAVVDAIDTVSTRIQNRWNGTSNEQTEGELATAFKNAKRKNLLWYALKSTKSADMVMANGKEDNDFLETVMSMFGTSIVNMPLKDDVATALDSNNVNQNHILDFKDFMKGGTGLLIYRCKDAGGGGTNTGKHDVLGCLKIDWEPTNIESFYEKVKRVLVGNPDTATLGIVDKVRMTGETISDQEKSILVALGPNATRLTNLALKAPGVARDFAEDNAHAIAYEASVEFFRQIHKMVVNSLSQVDDPAVGPYLTKLNKRYGQLLQQMDNYAQVNSISTYAMAQQYQTFMQTTTSRSYMVNTRAVTNRE